MLWSTHNVYYSNSVTNQLSSMSAFWLTRWNNFIHENQWHRETPPHNSLSGYGYRSQLPRRKYQDSLLFLFGATLGGLEEWGGKSAPRLGDIPAPSGVSFFWRGKVLLFERDPSAAEEPLMSAVPRDKWGYTRKVLFLLSWPNLWPKEMLQKKHPSVKVNGVWIVNESYFQFYIQADPKWISAVINHPPDLHNHFIERTLELSWIVESVVAWWTERATVALPFPKELQHA